MKSKKEGFVRRPNEAEWLRAVRENSVVLDRHFGMVERRRARDARDIEAEMTPQQRADAVAEWFKLEGVYDTLHLGS